MPSLDGDTGESPGYDRVDVSNPHRLEDRDSRSHQRPDAGPTARVLFAPFPAATSPRGGGSFRRCTGAGPPRPTWPRALLPPAQKHAWRVTVVSARDAQGRGAGQTLRPRDAGSGRAGRQGVRVPTVDSAAGPQPVRPLPAFHCLSSRGFCRAWAARWGDGPGLYSGILKLSSKPSKRLEKKQERS